MGEEKLDNAVYAIRGYADLADLARARGDAETRRWATKQAERLIAHFETTWWYGGDTRSYADSLDDPGNDRVFQRHWIGLTPTDAVLPALPGRAAGPLASRATRTRPSTSTSGPATPASSGCSTPAPDRPPPRPATPARPATRSSPPCPVSAASSP